MDSSSCPTEASATKPPPPPPSSAYIRPTVAALKHRYGYHAPVGDQASRYNRIRDKILEVATVIVDATPVCPEQTRALNALDEAMFLANASIARHDVPATRE